MLYINIFKGNFKFLIFFLKWLVTLKKKKKILKFKTFKLY